MRKPQLKPEKPFKEFPLFAHASGVWAKKIKGQMRYFGPWSDPDGAYAKYLKEKDYLFAGQKPPEAQADLNSLISAFLAEKEGLRDTGDITEQSYYEYETVCNAVKAHFGGHRPIASILPSTFAGLRTALSKKQDGKQYSAVTLKRRLTIARMIFVYANEEMGFNLRYKRGLQPPSSRTIRQAEQQRGKRLYAAADIRKLIDNADPYLKAMILLGINCGFGPDDCVRFPLSSIKSGFHNFARNKTGIERRCPLWEETKAALNALPKTDGQVFNGRVWNSFAIGRMFTALCKDNEVTNLGHYSLRRTFENLARNAEVNQSVIDKILGHIRQDMSEVYNQHTYDQQLVKCVTFVHDWLYGKIKLA